VASAAPSKDQTTGIVERVIYGVAMAVLMKLVAKGWLDADMAPYIAGGAVTAVGGAYAWWINRPKAIVQSAAALPGTIVVTTHDLAAATPDQSNIVSNKTNEVTSK
jgi:hypothetical protein